MRSTVDHVQFVALSTRFWDKVQRLTFHVQQAYLALATADARRRVGSEWKRKFTEAWDLLFEANRAAEALRMLWTSNAFIGAMVAPEVPKTVLKIIFGFVDPVDDYSWLKDVNIFFYKFCDKANIYSNFIYMEEEKDELDEKN